MPAKNLPAHRVTFTTTLEGRGDTEFQIVFEPAEHYNYSLISVAGWSLGKWIDRPSDWIGFNRAAIDREIRRHIDWTPEPTEEDFHE